MNDLAFSAAPCSSTSSFALLIKPMSAVAINVKGCSSSGTAGGTDGSSATSTGHNKLPLRRMSPHHRRPPPATAAWTATMNSEFPTDLSPTDHPVLVVPESKADAIITTNNTTSFRPKSHSVSSSSPQPPVLFALETPLGKSGNNGSTASSAFNQSNSGVERQGRPKKLTRYHTMPATFEQISEIDEELYAKQNPHEKEEANEDDDSSSCCSSSSFLSGNLRRTASIGSPYSCLSYNRKRSSLEVIKNAKARSHSAGAVLFPCSSSAGGGQKHHHHHGFVPLYRGIKQRSQETLLSLQGATTLPTIPEELRQQMHNQQNHNSPLGNEQHMAEDCGCKGGSSQSHALQRSRSADETVDQC